MKKILLVVVIIVLLSLGLYIGMSVVKKKNFEVTNETEEDEVEKWFRENREKEEEFNKKYYISEEDIYEIAKSSPDWEKVDIAEDKKEILMKKYPNGILGGNDYDDMYIEEGYQNLISTMDGPLEFHIIATKGLKKDRYKIDGTGFGNFFAKNNFEIYEIVKFEITDENGNKVNSGLPMDEEHWMSNIYKIAKQDDNEVGKSEDFYKRYPNFTGILNPYHYDDTNAIEIKWDETRTNYDNRELYCSVYYPYRFIYIDYIIKFTTDDNNYIDTFETSEIEKKEFLYEINKYKNVYFGGIIQKLVYDDRNWSVLPLTENFRLKFSPESGIFNRNDIVKYEWIYFNKDRPDKIILKVTGINKDTTYYGLVYELNSDKTMIDNIVIKVLNVSNHKDFSSDEIYNMF